MIFERYPALRTACILVVSVLSVKFLKIEGAVGIWPPALATGFFALLAFVAFRFKFKVLAFPLACIALFCLVWCRFQSVQPPDKTLATLSSAGRTVAVHGVVDGSPQTRDGFIRFSLAVDSVAVSRNMVLGSTGRLLVRVPSGRPIVYGEELRLMGKLTAPRNRRNPGEFDYAEYLGNRNIVGLLSVRNSLDIESTGTQKGNWFLYQLVYPLKSFVLETNRKFLTVETAAFLNGLLVGARQDIDPELLDAFAKTGTIHILSISGLHVAFIAGMLFAFFTLVRLPFAVRIYLTLAGLLLYAAMADFSPSVTRATLMIGLVMAGQAHERRGNALNSLFVALILIVWFDPRTLFEIGFQLSFAAVLSLVLVYPRLEEWSEKHGLLHDNQPALLKRSIQLLLVSLAAQIGTLPLAAYYFNNIPLLAIVANVLVVPLSGVVMAVGFLTVAAAPLSSTLAGWYGSVNELLIAGMTKTATLAASMPLARWQVFGFGLAHTVAFYGIVVALLRWDHRSFRRKFVIAAACTVCIAVWYGGLQSPALQVYYLDVGQGDASFIQTPGGKTILIDAGDRGERFDNGRHVVAPFLRRLGIKKIDYVIASHPHDDHVGGLPCILREFEIGMVLDAGQRSSSPAYGEVLELTRSGKFEYRTPRAGDVLAIEDNVHLYFFHPTDVFVSKDKEAPFNTNNASLVVQLRYDETRFLWMGDAEQKALAAMRRFSSMAKSDVLKVSHHGSWNGTDRTLLQMVAPQWAVISCGFQNKFDHPSRSVLLMLDEIGSKTFRTSDDGAVIFRSDGRRVEEVHL